MLPEPIVLVHGGAGDIPDSRVSGKIAGVKFAARTGYKRLLETNNVLDAVEEAIKVMELDENFNAGYGSVLTNAGTVEMEASLMHGKTGKVGCVSLIKDMMHPISIARKVMEETPHNFLAGEEANKFAVEQGFEVLPEGTLITQYAREALEEWQELQKSGGTKFARTEVGPGEVGTVGAVAVDTHGNLAVATSTGGITGKYKGRIGDTPVIGAGTYCSGAVGVSTTGHGETIMKACLGHDIWKRYQANALDIRKATKDACKEMTRQYEGTGGAIALTNYGEIGIYFTSKRMAWAYQKQNRINFGINKGDDYEEILE